MWNLFPQFRPRQSLDDFQLFPLAARAAADLLSSRYGVAGSLCSRRRSCWLIWCSGISMMSSSSSLERVVSHAAGAGALLMLGGLPGWVIHTGTAGNGQCDGAFPVCLPRAGALVPFGAHQPRLTEEVIHPVGVLACPEREHSAQDQVGQAVIDFALVFS